MKKFSLILTLILFISSVTCFSDEKNLVEEQNKQMEIQSEKLKDNIQKITFDKRAKLHDIEEATKKYVRSWSTDEDISIQKAQQESISIKQKLIELTDTFESIFLKNQNKVKDTYDKQIKTAANYIKKTQQESAEEYKERLEQVKNDLEDKKENSLFEDANETLQTMIQITNSLEDRLKYFQTELFYDESNPKAEFVSISDLNINDFVITVTYDKKNYLLEYDFSEVGKGKAELMQQTHYQFVIEPLFSINNNLEKELTAFNVTHMGMKTEKVISLPNNIEFKSIPKLSKYRCIYKINNTNYKSISAGGYHTVGLKSNGTVIACGNNDNGQCDVSKWKDIVSVSAGNCHTVGLKKDGTVVACGNNYYGQCNVMKWENIVAISAGKEHTVGLQEDGTVIAIGNNVFGQCDVKKWKNITAISAGGNHTVGLRDDDTVVAVGYNKNRQCNVQDWRGIIEISAGEYHTLGLMRNKTVVAIGSNDNWQCNIARREHIIAISAAEDHSVALKENGDVVATGINNYGQCNVDPWGHILEVSAGLNFTIGLRENGTVIAVGNKYYDQCDIEDWNLFEK